MGENCPKCGRLNFGVSITHTTRCTYCNEVMKSLTPRQGEVITTIRALLRLQTEEVREMILDKILEEFAPGDAADEILCDDDVPGVREPGDPEEEQV